MKLSEKGLLSLSDLVSKHFPSNLDFDTNGATIENLLHMESGIPNPAPNAAAMANFYGQPEDPLRVWTPREILASVPAIRSKPGDHYVYENVNYMLLALVIEETTHMSVAAALRSSVLADPRFSSMVYQPEERPKGPLALPFLQGQVRPNIMEVGGGYLPTKADTSMTSGYGCMASDSGSLAMWGYLLFGGQLVSGQSLLCMTDFGNGVYVQSEQGRRMARGGPSDRQRRIGPGWLLIGSRCPAERRDRHFGHDQPYRRSHGFGVPYR